MVVTCYKNYGCHQKWHVHLQSLCNHMIWRVLCDLLDLVAQPPNLVRRYRTPISKLPSKFLMPVACGRICIRYFKQHVCVSTGWNVHEVKEYLSAHHKSVLIRRKARYQLVLLEINQTAKRFLKIRLRFLHIVRRVGIPQQPLVDNDASGMESK